MRVSVPAKKNVNKSSNASRKTTSSLALWKYNGGYNGEAT